VSDPVETEETTEEEHAPTLTEAVAAMTPEERGDDPDAVVEAPEAKQEPAREPNGKFQAAGRRGARELRKLDRARQELSAREEKVRLAEAERAELAEKRELEQLRKDDPAAYIERTGLDVDKATQKWLASGRPEAKVDALAARLDAEKAEREAERKASEAGTVKARIAEAEKTFVAALSEKAEEYPAIADMDPGELFASGNGPAYQVAREIKAEMDRMGYASDAQPTDEQIMRELNAREEARIAKRAERMGYTRGSAPAPRVAPVAKPASKTIQGATTRQRAAAPPAPKDYSRAMNGGDRANAIAEELAAEMRKASGR
jgi:hypothetical protein